MIHFIMIIDKQTIEFNLSFHFSRSNLIANSIFFLQTDFNEQATANSPCTMKFFVEQFLK